MATAEEKAQLADDMITYGTSIGIGPKGVLVFVMNSHAQAYDVIKQAYDDTIKDIADRQLEKLQAELLEIKAKEAELEAEIAKRTP